MNPRWVNQAAGVYTADHPGYILGTGSIEVLFPPLDGMLLIVR
jgi:hypothetical protein